MRYRAFRRRLIVRTTRLRQTRQNQRFAMFEWTCIHLYEHFRFRVARWLSQRRAAADLIVAYAGVVVVPRAMSFSASAES